MLRAKRARGEDVPASGQDGLFPGSLESVLALSLALTVVLASVALMERSSHLSRVLAELQSEHQRASAHRGTSQPRPVEPRFPADLVVLLSLDTLRADHLDAYGYARETAPNLRRLAEEGVLFESVCAQSSQTLTSHKSLFAGKYPNTLMREETGQDLVDLAQLGGDPHRYLVETFSQVRGTLAQSFADAGFATCGLTDGAWMSRDAGFEPGFQVFDDSGGGLAGVLPRGLAWLDAVGDAPAFLFLHAYDIHCPYPTREPFDSAFCHDHGAHIELGDKCGKGPLSGLELSAADRAAVIDHYDAGILSADDYVGQFLDGLRARGLYERALIVVTSDHGESLGERDTYGHGGLHLEQLFVPLILKPPSDWGLAPRVIEEPVELVDLHPTLLACARLPLSDELDGRSLLSMLYRGVRGKDLLVAQTVFEESPDFRSSPAKRSLLRPGRWQVIQDAAQGTAAFYTLEHDPAGLVPHPIAPEEFSALLDVLLEHRSAPAPHRPQRTPPSFNAELSLELQALGYAGLSEAGDPPSGSLR